jgi:hypothetical protein
MAGKLEELARRRERICIRPHAEAWFSSSSFSSSSSSSLRRGDLDEDEDEENEEDGSVSRLRR